MGVSVAALWKYDEREKAWVEVVKDVYARVVSGTLKVEALEASGYLERYVWPRYGDDAREGHEESTISVVLMVNAKFSAGVKGLDAIVENAEKFERLAMRTVEMMLRGLPTLRTSGGGGGGGGGAGEQREKDSETGGERAPRDVSARERVWLLRFFQHCINSLELEPVRRFFLRTVSLSVFHCLSERRREVELQRRVAAVANGAEGMRSTGDALQKHWNALVKRERKRGDTAPLENPMTTFMMRLLLHFIDTLNVVIVELESMTADAREKKYGSSRATSSAGTGTSTPGGGRANGGGNNNSIHSQSRAGDAVGAEAYEVEVEVDAAAERPDMELYFCESFMGFMIDVLSQLPTRRFVSALVREAAVVVKMDAMEMHRFPELALLVRLARMFRLYVDFPVDNETGETIDDEAIDTIRYGNALCFLKLCFKHWPQLRELSLGSVKAVADGGDDTQDCLLMKSLKCLDGDELTRMCCRQLRIMPEPDTNGDSDGIAAGGDFYASADFMRSVIVDHVVRGGVSSMRNTLVRMPIYPTEKLMYDANRLPAYSAAGGTGPFARGGDVTLALPKLNLQFLSLYDYLQRNFQLYRLEAAYEIRDDVNDVAKRMQPVLDYAPAGSDANVGGGGPNATGGTGETVRFRGWARMALPLRHFAVTQVKRPHVGDTIPSGVRAEARINLVDCGSYARQQYGRDNPIAAEWDEIRQRDVVFLLTIRPPARGAMGLAASSNGANAGAPTSGKRDGAVVDPVDAMKAYGIVAVRGAEVVEIRDANGKQWYNSNTSGPGGGYGGGKNGMARRPEGSQRTLILDLDPMQYHLDVEDLDRRGDDAEDVYASFNVVVRRNAKENNFKAVLGAIRDIIVSTSSAEGEGVLPEWLQDVFLGYGDPSAAKATAGSASGVGGGLSIVARSALIAASADGDAAAGQAVDDNELQYEALDLKDTFLDEEHVRASFENRTIEMIGNEKNRPVGPTTRCKVYIPIEPTAPRGGGTKSRKRKAGGETAVAAGPTPEELHQHAMEAYASSPVYVEPYARGMEGPYDEAEDMGMQADTAATVAAASTGDARETRTSMRRNTIRFTPVQVGAVVEAMRPGLTMIVGPPGTGKTDVAVQILSLLYHQNTAATSTSAAVGSGAGKVCGASRTLLITHSNSALNDVFEKISACDVPSRYLLRAGMGERDLNTLHDYSREGRIEYFLQRRLNLLAEVERLSQSLSATASALSSTSSSAAADRGANMGADVAFTCESAANFFTMYVRPKIEAFEAKVALSSNTMSASDVVELFPFGGFFNEDSVRAKLSGPHATANVETARQCFEHLRVLFAELRECRPFELLTTAKDRGDYIMTTLAKVVGMTTTHAALRRADFAKMNFEFDNIVMEEAAQVLEIETFIPLTLQSGTGTSSSAASPTAAASSITGEGSRLKRFILIGDHHQLPPVVQMGALAKYSHMDQSMFQRMIRLGMPHVQLNSQGRARPSIANLFNWHYKTLGDLPHVVESPEYRVANAGFAHEFQLVDVGSEGSSGSTGESSPTPYYYQNLAEAEYIVSCYQYMRLLGYPSSSVSILTTYRGQKHLIRDVVRARCSHPAFGPPHKITTVDKYQGQQNEYILLSLVRTKHIGHLRDVRRLIVALSRARKGLYVFGKIDLFRRCPELREAISRLLRYPDKLALVANEPFPATRMLDASEKLRPYFVASPDAMHQIVAQMTSYWESLHLQQLQQHEYEIQPENENPNATMRTDG